MASVLIVEDEPDIRFLLQRILTRHESFRIVGEAETGTEALELWRTLRPDAIVLDQRLRNESGLETAAVILSENPGVVIVLFTAFADAALERHARNLGVARCIPKANLAHLPAALADALQTHQVGRDL